MRLIVATDVTVRGGVDTYVSAYLDVLRLHGHDVYLAFEVDTESSVGKDAEARGFNSFPLPLYRRWHGPAEVAEALQKFLTTVRPEGIHIVTGSPRSCLVLRALAIASEIPLIITESQVGESLHLTPVELAQIRDSYRAAAAVVFVAEGNRRTMSHVVGIEGVRTVVIPNGVDVPGLARFHRKTLRPSVPATLVTVARLSPEKSLDSLLAAVSLLPRDVVDSLYLYGDGPMREQLNRQIDELDLADRVFLKGWIPEVAPMLRECDLFVLPSTAEGMPYAVLEAMAVGLPVVCSSIPGHVEALADGRAGRLVPSSSPEDLTVGITESLLSPEHAEAQARYALEHVRLRHDRATSMKNTARLWTKAGFR